MLSPMFKKSFAPQVLFESLLGDILDSGKIGDLPIGEDEAEVLENTAKEVLASAKSGLFLGAVTLLGSLLEGILLCIGKNNEGAYRATKAGPDELLSDKGWTLYSLTQATKKLELIGTQERDLANKLGNARNCIHPREQMSGSIPEKGLFIECLEGFNQIVSILQKTCKQETTEETA